MRPPHLPSRIATWLCLVAVTLLALLPTGGLVLCLADGGHLGFGGVETAATQVACPCEQAQEEEAGTETPAEHPPCDDLLLDAPDGYQQSDAPVANDLAAPDDAAPEVLFDAAPSQPVLARSVVSGMVRPPGRPPAALRELRTVVLIV